MRMATCTGRSQSSEASAEAAMPRLIARREWLDRLEVERGVAAEPAGVPLVRKAVNFAGAAYRHVRAGSPKAPLSLVAVRVAACEGCSSFRPSDRTCSEVSCGCYVHKKAAWLDERCPLGRWPDHRSSR